MGVEGLGAAGPRAHKAPLEPTPHKASWARAETGCGPRTSCCQFKDKSPWKCCQDIVPASRRLPHCLSPHSRRDPGPSGPASGVTSSRTMALSHLTSGEEWRNLPETMACLNQRQFPFQRRGHFLSGRRPLRARPGLGRPRAWPQGGLRAAEPCQLPRPARLRTLLPDPGPLLGTLRAHGCPLAAAPAP